MPTPKPPTRHAFVTALVLAVAGALFGAAAMTATYAKQTRVALDMTGDLPRIAFGFYPPERAGNEPFAWTARRARLVLAGLDRRSAWICSVRVRGGRSAPLAQPIVEIAVDGASGSRTVTNDYETVDVVALPRPGASGLTLTITSSTTFQPGPADTRELGVQVNRVSCEPVNTRFAWPPRDAVVDAAIAGALFGGVLGLIGIGPWIALVSVLLLAMLQAMPLASGPAPYTTFADQALRLAIGTTLAIAGVTFAIEWVRRTPLSTTALAAIALSGATFYLQMLGLLHPSKLPVDAVFHAHRLERVLSGWFYFTQPVRNAEFPYAIGLYVFAAPFASIVTDHVLLLRLVVCACDAVAGALLYWMIVRVWSDGAIGLIAVLLFHCVPLPFTVIGNANLTNAFGQSAALVAIAAATTWRLAAKDFVQLLALTLLSAAALLSHVSTLASFGLTMSAIGVLYWLFGSATLRPQARSILVALSVAVIVSIALYYGHFLGVFLSVGKVGATATAATTAAAAESAAPTPILRRVIGGLAQSARDLGWPVLLLAIVGVWRVWTQLIEQNRRDRLVLALAAWGVTYVVLFLAGSLAPASRDFERYAVEFLSRIDAAICPAVAILAATGAAWAWRAGPVPRLIASALLLAAAVIAGQQWIQWFAFA
jgi:hypothetical protein